MLGKACVYGVCLQLLRGSIDLLCIAMPVARLALEPRALALRWSLRFGAYVLRNAWTKEEALVDAPADGTEWQIMCEDGEAFLVSVAEEPLLVDVDDVFHWRAVQSEDGRILVLRAGQQDEQAVPLESFERSHTLHAVDINMPPGGARASVRMAVYKHRRFGAVRVSLPDLYRALGLEAYGGEPGRWVQSSSATWERMLGESGFGDSFLRSRQNEPGRLNHGEDGRRHLDWPSLDVAGLLWLLCTWGCAPRHRGGFRRPEDRDAATRMLSAWCRVLQLVDVRLAVFLDRQVSCEIAKAPAGLTPVALHVRHGMVQVGGLLRQLVAHAADPLAQAWLQLAFPGRSDEAELDIFGFLQVVAADAHESEASRVLLRQLVRACAQEIAEAVASRTERGEGGIPGMSLGASASVALQLDMRVLQGYCQAITQATADHSCLRQLSCATDKSRVTGMPVTNSAFALESNLAFWAPPQVTQLAPRGGRWLDFGCRGFHISGHISL